MSSSALVWSRAMRVLSAAMCPPVMCPVSWAMTPITSLGVLACNRVPVLMKTLRPSITNALKLSCFTMRMVMCEPRPAALKIGRE